MSLIIPDTYDKLFLRCNGTTTTFVDSSTANPKTITANGNATQIPRKFNRTAGFFNGVSDYVVVPDHADWDFGTGDFTVEFFINWRSESPSNPIVFCIGAYSAGVYMAWDSTNLDVYISSSHYTFATGGRSLNTWYHVALVRSGSNLMAFINGVQKGTTQSNSTNLTGIATGVGIGNSPSPAASQYFHGWIKEFRISNSARYTAGFTPTTTQFSSDSNTKLLLHFDTPASAPLGPAAYFDGTGDYLSVADHPDWDFGTGDYTVETFAQFNATGGIYYIISRNGDTDFSWLVNASTFYHYRPSGYVSGTFTPTVGKWYHLALVHSGTSVRMYIDGKELTLTSNSETDNFSSSNPITIGAKSDGNYGMNGSFREFRISNTARYTSAFTPSQTGFTVDANTVLYIKGNEDNGATTFVDSETTPKTVTTNGDTKIKYTEDYRSCIFKDETGKFPYPVGSAKVDFFSAFGSGVGYMGSAVTDYLSVEDSADWDFGTGDWDIEAFIRPDATSVSGGHMPIFDSGYAGGVRILGDSNDQATTVVCVAGTNYTFARTLIANHWYHIAVVRYGNILRCFLNGTQIGADKDVTGKNITGLSAGVRIGGELEGLYKWNGNPKWDNIRISKGIARYTATFNPPDDYGSSSSIKNINGLAYSSVKTKNGLAVASIKTINGLA